MPRPHALIASLVFALTFGASLHASAAGEQAGALAVADMPPQVSEFVNSVLHAADAQGQSFAVVDKPLATVWVFDARGRPLGQSPVLVGQAVGDVAPPDIGSRPLSRVKLHEKITSAGRYQTEAGRNHKGEDIVWLDYDSALSMHRVRNVPGESRAQRLATPTVADNRISFGCINVPAVFFDRHIKPLFSEQSGVIYVLPERQSLAATFPFMRRVLARP